MSAEKNANPSKYEALRRIQICHLNEGTANILDLSIQALVTLPKEIAELKKLIRLDLCGNLLSELPPEIGELSTLTQLDLSGNQLTVLPPEIGKLKALTRLDLSGNLLTTLPPEIGKLKSLTDFYADTRLISLPAEIGQLKRLTRLDLSGNELTTLPPEIGQLESLREIDLRNNQLTTLPPEIGKLNALRQLDLRGNQLKTLPMEIRLIKKLKELYLHDNPALGLPAEVLGPTWEEVRDRQVKPASPKTILDYLSRTQRGKKPLNEAKLILVGRGNAGKTCLVNQLLYNKFEHQEETPGIVIQQWDVSHPNATRSTEKLRFHVWDFGGQRILHGTHQFFLTERTIYLLVLSKREDSATSDAEYWLQLIKSLGGKSPVIVALNKSRTHPFDVNRGLLLEKYPFITGFLATDCADDVGPLGIDELKKAILKEFGMLDHCQAQFPLEWFRIKERLSTMPENFLEAETYQKICREFGEPDTSAQHDLANFLHVLGIALYYADDPRLKDQRVLKPTWVTEGIYTVLRTLERKPTGGVLRLMDLQDELNITLYPRATHGFLLRLMEKFKLCFRMPGNEERYLVPELLSESQPNEIAKLLSMPGLGFRYQYAVVPESLLPRFIVQTHSLSSENGHLRWRTGVVLSLDGCCAIVRADARERRVEILITGSAPMRRGLLAIVRAAFEEQHAELNGLDVSARVPVPGEKDAKGLDVTVSYDDLLYYEADGEEDIRPEGMRKKVKVAMLLDGIESRGARPKSREEILARFKELKSYQYAELCLLLEIPTSQKPSKALNDYEKKNHICDWADENDKMTELLEQLRKLSADWLGY